MEKKSRGDQPFKVHKSTHKKPRGSEQPWAPLNPYALSNTFFAFPWMMPQQALVAWFSLQQKFWEGYWNLLSWQCWTLHQIAMDNTRAMTHGMELSSDPETLYRYMRMNWKKPYEQGATNIFTISKLYGQIWADCFLAWQNALSQSDDKESSKTD